MKRFLSMMALSMLGLLIFAACGGDDDNDDGTQTVTAMKVTPQTLTFGNEGGTQTVSVQASRQAEATSNAAWCTVTAGTMTATLKVTTLTVSVAAMTSETSDRTATITVKAGDESATISVTQQAGDIIKIEKTEYDVGAEGGTVDVALTANGDYTVATTAAWITEGERSAGRQLLSVAPNTGDERTASVTLQRGKAQATITIRQAKGEQPAANMRGARELAALMAPGWNLGNTMEPPVSGLNAETAWQQTKTTQQIIDYVAAQGFRSVRIPCSWNCHTNASGEIDAAWTARVRELVDYCLKAGLIVVLNDHWDNGWIETNGFNNLAESNVSAKEQTLKSLWTQIAQAFGDYDDRLIFAGLNEPNADTQAKTDVLLRYEQAFVDAVRATGGNNASRALIVQGPSTDIEKSDQFYDPSRINDPAEGALMVEVHYYTPWNLCGMEKDESWGKMFYYWGAGNHLSGSSHNANWGEEADLKKLFQRMKTKFVDKGYPVYIGEYGCQWRDVSQQSDGDQAKHDASVKAFHKEVCQQAVAMGMVPVVWDINYANQQGTKGVMTVINRATLSIFCQPAMEGIREGCK